MNIEKVIRIIDELIFEAQKEPTWKTENVLRCLKKELLKEQESIPCGEKIKAGDVVLDFYECGYCKNAIRKPWRYCPFCGKEVKWDGSDRKTLVRK